MKEEVQFEITESIDEYGVVTVRDNVSQMAIMAPCKSPQLEMEIKAYLREKLIRLITT